MYESLNIDGRTINNDPFKLTQDILNDRLEELRKEKLRISLENDINKISNDKDKSSSIAHDFTNELFEKFKKDKNNFSKLNELEFKITEKSFNHIDSTIIQPYVHKITEIVNDASKGKKLGNDFGKDMKRSIELTQKKSAKEFNSTVLMIDPFPNHTDLPETEEKYTPLRALKFMFSKIISAMIGELRMKEDLLKAAINKDDHTKFLIIPDRKGVNKETENHIACGSLGGFGGFISKEFREHDFILGRINCQQFLKKHFSVLSNKNNPIINNGYHGIDRASCIIEKDGEKYLQIIPDIKIVKDKNTDTYSTTKMDKEENIDYPSIDYGYILGLEKKLKRRISLIIKNAGNGTDLNSNKTRDSLVESIRKNPWYKKIFNRLVKKPFTNLYLWVGKSQGKGVIADSIIDVIIADLHKNGLIKDK